MSLVDLLKGSVAETCETWNLYGPAEATLVSTYHRVVWTAEAKDVPIGRPLPGYRCLIVDEFFESVFVGQEGELLVGGVGVFAGYLGRDDLTTKALINIDGHVFYRTGDLVRLNPDGLLYYVGRQDHQIKLHGQRIELGEIERCLLDVSSNVSACVVVKWDDDHLVAYIQSVAIDEEQLRKHCRSRLPPFMVPSVFIVLEQLPLNANGKLDRQRLPTLDFSSLSLTSSSNEGTKAKNEVERHIHSLWCELLHCTDISTNQSIFHIGGHSLLLMQLYHRYKTIFHLDKHTFPITHIFQYPTIVDHARLIQQSLLAVVEHTHTESWLALNLTQGTYRLSSLSLSLLRFTSSCFFFFCNNFDLERFWQDTD